MLHASINVDLPCATPWRDDMQGHTLVLYANAPEDYLPPLRILLGRGAPLPNIYLPKAAPPLELAPQPMVLRWLVVDEQGLEVLMGRAALPAMKQEDEGRTLLQLICYIEGRRSISKDAHFFEEDQAFPTLYANGRQWLEQRLRHLGPLPIEGPLGEQLVTTREGDHAVTWDLNTYIERWYEAKHRHEVEKKREELAKYKRRLQEIEIESKAARAAAVHAVNLGGKVKDIANQLNISITDVEFLLTRPISCLSVQQLIVWKERVEEIEEAYDARLHCSIEDHIRKGL